MTPARRIIFALNVAALAAVLALWPVSYYRQPLVIVRGYGASIERGRVWLAGPETIQVRTTVDVDAVSDTDIEAVLLRHAASRWKPVRRLSQPAPGFWIVELWLPALVLAASAVLLWRRRRRRETARGFEVLGSADPEKDR